jgi:hypothetical protein
VLSWHPEPADKRKIIRFRAAEGPWDQLTTQIWPIEKKLESITWPPPMSLSTMNDGTHYGHFRTRFKNSTGHRLITTRPKAGSAPAKDPDLKRPKE